MGHGIWYLVRLSTVQQESTAKVTGLEHGTIFRIAAISEFSSGDDESFSSSFFIFLSN